MRACKLTIGDGIGAKGIGYYAAECSLYEVRTGICNRYCAGSCKYRTAFCIWRAELNINITVSCRLSECICGNGIFYSY